MVARFRRRRICVVLEPNSSTPGSTRAQSPGSPNGCSRRSPSRSRYLLARGSPCRCRRASALPTPRATRPLSTSCATPTLCDVLRQSNAQVALREYVPAMRVRHESTRSRQPVAPCAGSQRVPAGVPTNTSVARRSFCRRGGAASVEASVTRAAAPGRVPRHRRGDGADVPIGAWVLDAACRELRRWPDAHTGSQPLGVAVTLGSPARPRPRQNRGAVPSPGTGRPWHVDAGDH